MKKITVFWITILSMFFIGSFLISKPAKAYSPIIAVCSNGLSGSITTSGHQVEQLFEVRLDNYILI